MRSILCNQSILVNHGIDQARAVTLKCRSWSCDLCRPERKKQLIGLARSGAPKVFITITVNPAVGESPVQRARMLVKSWRLIVKRAKKRYNYKKLDYLCVFEATKAGEPHLHILSRVPWLDQKWLSRQMNELVGAPIVWIEKVRSARQMANYLAKYIGKAPQRFDTLKRYWFTNGWELDKWESDDPYEWWAKGWEIRDTDLVTLQENWDLMGWHTRLRSGMLWGGEGEPP